jgi:hypothetical protein
MRFEIIREYEISKISDFFLFLRRKRFFMTTLSINNSSGEPILLLNELEHDSQKQKEIYEKYIKYITGLIIADRTDSYANMVSMALDSLGMCKNEITEEGLKINDSSPEKETVSNTLSAMDSTINNLSAAISSMRGNMK